jgi:hypothetical protein
MALYILELVVVVNLSDVFLPLVLHEQLNVLLEGELHLLAHVESFNELEEALKLVVVLVVCVLTFDGLQHVLEVSHDN